MTRRDIIPSRREVLLAALGALLLFVAYPPFSLVVPSFVALVPLLWALENVGTRAPAGEREPAGGSATWRVVLIGFWFGVLANGLVLYWMVVALWHFTPLSLAGYLAAILLVLGPLWALLSWATWHVRRRTTIPLAASFPLIWTAGEWLQGHLSEIGFPWLGLGTSLVRAPTLVQWADLAGARGVTLWLAWANVAALVALRRRTWRPLVPVAATIAVALGYGLWREKTLRLLPALTVAVVQPNLSVEEKREGRDDARIVLELLALTRRARQDSNVRLVVWPEAAVPSYFVNHPEWEGWIDTTARALATPILAGGLDVEFAADGSYEYYNAAFLFDSTGSDRRQPSYRKKYLVPIVERVPFLNPRWFGNLKYFGGFGHGARFPVYRVAGQGFGVLICYESAFEDLARRYRRTGADFLVNITNDAWFGRTVAPYQHASHLVMRAIETRMGVARAANTGISQFVDPLGRTYQSTPLFVERIEQRTVLTSEARTLYVRLGDWVALVSLVGTAACFAAAWRRR